MFRPLIEHPDKITIFKQKLVDPERRLQFASVGDMYRGSRHGWLLSWGQKQIPIETNNGEDVEIDSRVYSLFTIEKVGESAGMTATWRIPSFEFGSAAERDEAALLAAEALAVGRRTLPGTLSRVEETRVRLGGRDLISGDFGYSLEPAGPH